MTFLSKIRINSMKKKHQNMLKEAMLLQRNGKIPEFASLSAEAEKLAQKISQLESS